MNGSEMGAGKKPVPINIFIEFCGWGFLARPCKKERGSNLFNGSDFPPTFVENFAHIKIIGCKQWQQKK
jgi:hypothetical protein